MITPELLALLRDAQRNRSQEQLAELLGIGAPRLSRASSGKGSSLGAKTLLKLADLEGLDAGAVLRAAGKGDLADLLDRLYPERGRPSRAEDELVDLFRAFLRRQPVRKLTAIRELLSGSGVE